MGAGAAVVSGRKGWVRPPPQPQPHLVQQQETYHFERMDRIVVRAQDSSNSTPF